MKLKVERGLLERLGLDPLRYGFDASGRERELEDTQLAAVLESASGELERERSRGTLMQERLGRFAALFSDRSGAAYTEFPEHFDYDGALAELRDALEAPRKATAELRKQAQAAYRAGLGERAADPAMLALLESAPGDQLRALALQFGAQLEEQHPLKCAQCGHGTLTRASSESAEAPSEKPDPATDEPDYDLDAI